MTLTPRLVLDTNVVVSGFLWGGNPGKFLLAAGDGEVRLFSSRILVEEIRLTLGKPHLEKAIAATGLTGADFRRQYRQLVTMARPAELAESISRDPDDDHVIACAIAARADWIVTGDKDLLVLNNVERIRIGSVKAALTEFGIEVS